MRRTPRSIPSARPAHEAAWLRLTAHDGALIASVTAHMGTATLVSNSGVGMMEVKNWGSGLNIGRVNDQLTCYKFKAEQYASQFGTKFNRSTELNVPQLDTGRPQLEDASFAGPHGDPPVLLSPLQFSTCVGKLLTATLHDASNGRTPYPVLAQEINGPKRAGRSVVLKSARP